MKGAREYTGLFEAGRQYGKLYIVFSSHARGKTLNIYVLLDGVTETSGRGYPLSEDAVEVYGIVGGQSGWTEWYGWLYQGKWQEDFQQLVKKRRAEVAAKKEEQAEEKSNAETTKKNRTEELLAKY